MRLKYVRFVLYLKCCYSIFKTKPCSLLYNYYKYRFYLFLVIIVSGIGGINDQTKAL